MSILSYLQVQNVTLTFLQGLKQVEILKDITYQFQKGSSYGLMGASGSGKSTLLALLSGLETPTSGQVSLQGRDLYAGQPDDRLGMCRQLGVLFQSPHLIDELSLIENIMIKGLIEYQEYDIAYQKAQDLLNQIGLAGKEDQRPRSLSGGEQQRACIARALFAEPSFIIADEPTAHLDDATARDIMSVLCMYQNEKDAGLLIATHDAMVLGMLDITLKLEAGNLCTVPCVLPKQAMEQKTYG